ncbi:MAG: hypothetical protein JWQ54_4071 [Mucilaginibacter sp.]|nr:hypothetical protein [Mucilaginibacter sp.]
MREVFETYFKIYIRWFSLFLEDLVMRQFQPFLRKPLSWRSLKGFLEILLKDSQAPAG